jgi:hypothetical protein
LFASVAKEALKWLQRKNQVALESMQKVVSNIFGKSYKGSSFKSYMLYVARQGF